MLSKLVFPLYLLPKGTIVEKHGTVLVGLHPVTKEYMVIDDTSIEQPTLGKRRLFIDRPFPLYKSVVSFNNLVKVGKMQVVNALGEYFIYAKSIRTHVVFMRIRSVKEILYNKKKIYGVQPYNLHCVIEAHKRPPEGYNYIGAIKYKYGYIFYGYYNQAYKDSKIHI